MKKFERAAPTEPITLFWGGAHTAESFPPNKGWRITLQEDGFWWVWRHDHPGCARVQLTDSDRLEVWVYTGLREESSEKQGLADAYTALPPISGVGLGVIRFIAITCERAVDKKPVPFSKFWGGPHTIFDHPTAKGWYVERKDAVGDIWLLARRGKPGCAMLYRLAEDDPEEVTYRLAIYRESPEELGLQSRAVESGEDYASPGLGPRTIRAIEAAVKDLPVEHYRLTGDAPPLSDDSQRQVTVEGGNVELSNQISALQKKLERRGTRIAELADACADAKRTILEQRETIHDQADRILERQETIHDQADRILEQHRKISDLHAELADLTARLEQVENDLSASRAGQEVASLKLQLKTKAERELELARECAEAVDRAARSSEEVEKLQAKLEQCNIGRARSEGDAEHLAQERDAHWEELCRVKHERDTLGSQLDTARAQLDARIREDARWKKEFGVLKPVEQHDEEVKLLRREVEMLREGLGQMSLAVDNWHARAFAAEAELDRLRGDAPVSGEAPPRAEYLVAHMSSVITRAKLSRVALHKAKEMTGGRASNGPQRQVIVEGELVSLSDAHATFIAGMCDVRSLIAGGAYGEAQRTLQYWMKWVRPGDSSLQTLSLVDEKLGVLLDQEKLARGLGATPGEAALDARILGSPEPDEGLQEALKELFSNVLVDVNKDCRLVRVPEFFLLSGLRGVSRLKEVVAGESEGQMGLVLQFDDRRFFLRISHRLNHEC